MIEMIALCSPKQVRIFLLLQYVADTGDMLDTIWNLSLLVLFFHVRKIYHRSNIHLFKRGKIKERRVQNCIRNYTLRYRILLKKHHVETGTVGPGPCSDPFSVPHTHTPRRRRKNEVVLGARYRATLIRCR